MTDLVNSGTKLSLEEMSTGIDVQAHNSNMSNLAHALRHLAEARKEAEAAYAAFKADADAIEADIRAAGTEDAANLTYDQVKGPYGRSRSIKLVHTKGDPKSW